MTMQIHWHIRITLDSSTMDRAKEMAKLERRTVSNYVASLIEKAQQSQEQAK